MKHIDDLGYTILFSNLTIFRQFLQSFVHEPWIKDLDFSSAEKVNKSFVSKKYKKTESDVIYKLKLNDREVYIYVLLEFQSSVDKFMAVRCLNYITNFYNEMIQSHKKNKVDGKSSLDKLPPIFPIVLYNGSPEWTAPLAISELIDNHSLLGEFGISFKYLKLAEREYSEEELTRINNIAAGIFLTEINKKDLEPMAEKIISFCDNEEDMHAVSLFFNWVKILFIHGKINDKSFESLEKLYESKNEAKSMLLQAINEAKERERKKGEKTGEVKASKRIARNLFVNGVDIKTISKATGLSDAEIKSLTKGLGK